MIIEKGAASFSKDANEANIPVDIWLKEEVDENSDAKTGKWELNATNYKPRKQQLETLGFQAIADTREELVNLIEAHIIPLYETALTQLRAISAGKAECLYYWKEES